MSNIKAEMYNGDELQMLSFKDITKHAFDKSLFAMAVYPHTHHIPYFLILRGKKVPINSSYFTRMSSSLKSRSGLRYHSGVHKNGAQPKAVDNSVDSAASTALLPGVCTKATFSYEKSKDLWRQKETEEHLFMKTTLGKFLRPGYDDLLKEPHASISSIIGIQHTEKRALHHQGNR